MAFGMPLIGAGMLWAAQAPASGSFWHDLAGPFFVGRHRHRLRLHPDLHRRPHRRHRAGRGGRLRAAQHLAEPRRCDRRGRRLVHRGVALPHAGPSRLRHTGSAHRWIPVGPVGVRADRSARCSRRGPAHPSHRASCDGVHTSEHRHSDGDSRGMKDFSSTIGNSQPGSSDPGGSMTIVTRHDVRPTHQFVEVGGTRIFYRAAGPVDAPTLLLLHGFPSASHQFRRLIDALGTLRPGALPIGSSFKCERSGQQRQASEHMRHGCGQCSGPRAKGRPR